MKDIWYIIFYIVLFLLRILNLNLNRNGEIKREYKWRVKNKRNKWNECESKIS